MKKFILALAAIVLLSANANAKGPVGHHNSHRHGHSYNHIVHYQPPVHYQTVVIKHHQPQPYYNTHHVYYSNNHYKHDHKIAQTGAVLLGAGILALAVSSF